MTFLAPFLYQYAFIDAESGGLIEKYTDWCNWDVSANFGIGCVQDIALEVVPLVDEEGQQLKIPHAY